MPYYQSSRRATRFSSRKPHSSYKRTNRNTSSIDPRKFIGPATVANKAPYQPTHTFSDFAISPLLMRNLAAKGYEVPSPVQDQAIPKGLEGRDVIGIAGTGTGKTAAFGIPLLHKLMHDSLSRALVIAPTRELAQQIEDEFKLLAKGSGLFGVLLIGGTNMAGQLRDLRHRPRVIIGTPGRIKDHLERGSLQLDSCNIVVLDEVDRMLDMGFVNDVNDILAHTSEIRQSLFFSATMDSRVERIIQTYTKSPEFITVNSTQPSENVHKDIVPYVHKSEKIDKLHSVLNDEAVEKAIVFDETQRNVERLQGELVARGFVAEAIHGGKSQGQRQRALNKFKKNQATILVATDVAARGIDVADITHVINYTAPTDYGDYIHRIGRAGRAGQIGYALTFVEQSRQRMGVR